MPKQRGTTVPTSLLPLVYFMLMSGIPYTFCLTSPVHLDRQRFSAWDESTRALPFCAFCFGSGKVFLTSLLHRAVIRFRVQARHSLQNAAQALVFS